MPAVTLLTIATLAVELIPAVAFGCASERVSRTIGCWPRYLRIFVPAVLAAPYVLISVSAHLFRWEWLAVYSALPIVMAWLMSQAAAVDADQLGNWRDALILVTLGLAVDLRWFDGAWPVGLRGFGNLLLVDAGLYAFLGIRNLTGTGFNFRFRWQDWKIGLRELGFFAPFVLVLGLGLGFIHPHPNLPTLTKALLTWTGIFVFVAVPEELFFRAWVQNLLERRVGRSSALLIQAALFGLSHFNKRSAHFNWRYVLIAAVAGVFYGRAWREHRRVPASAITHTFVDWLWTWWF